LHFPPALVYCFRRKSSRVAVGGIGRLS